jgi:prepilin-type N-terminal cleavage/methylation domain-containing protein
LKPTNSERGFTIIEVLIAVVILTVALVALAEMMAITLRMQMLGRNETNAARLAQAKLDELVGVAQNDWAAPQIALNGGSLTANVADFNDVPVDSDGNPISYRRRWQVTAGPNDPGSDAGDLRIVTVRIIPTTPDSRTSATVELTSILRNPAP